MLKLVALLDPPSSASFGMVPFIVNGDGLAEPVVVGLAGGNRPLGLGAGLTLEEFIAAGHARALPDHDIRFPMMPTDRVAGWMGAGFRWEYLRLSLPIPDLASVTVTYGTKEGIFWIEPPETCYARLERWLLSVAPRAAKERSPDIARLMEQCLPTHEATMKVVSTLKTV